jgi:hypothetical protein
MAKEHLPKISQLIGAMVIKDTDCGERDAKNGDEILPDETLVPGKNSSCVVRIHGKPLAMITKTKANVPANIRTFHPLAPPKPGSKKRLKGTSLKAGNSLILQAQREDSTGVVVSTLKVQF